MQSNYKRLGDYIEETNIRNTALYDYPLLGVSIQKQFMPSIANTIGTDMSTYKVVYKNQFAYGPVTSRNGNKISIALLQNEEAALISQAYTSFRINNLEELLPEYLMMWFCRPEFDRYARFKSHGSAREIFDWQELCDTLLPVPSIEKQQAIVEEYNTIERRIELNNKLIEKLEETAQTLYKHWFVDFEYPSKEGKPYKSSGGKMVYNEELEKEIPEGWGQKRMSDLILISSGKSIQDQMPNGFPAYGAGGIVGYTSHYLYNEPILIIGRVGTHGKVFREKDKCWPSDNTLVIKSMYKNYIYFILKNTNYDELNRGGVQALITQSDLNNQIILNPNTLIVENFELMIDRMFSFLDLCNENINLLLNLKGLLLSRLATLE